MATTTTTHGSKNGATVVLNALATTIEMAGLSGLVKVLKKQQQEESDMHHRTWAENLWQRQEPGFRRMWADEAECGGGRVLMQLHQWEGDSVNQLCDTMELHGVFDATAAGHREFMHSLVVIEREADVEIGMGGARANELLLATSETDYLDAYCEPCVEQTLFTNEFLQWQLRFGNMECLLEDASSSGGT